MRSLPLLKLSLLVAVLGGAVVLGWWLHAAYWGDLRATVAYALVREAAASPAGEDGLREALAVDPENWLAQLGMGESRLFAGDLNAAEMHLRTALAGNPLSPRAHYAMGVVLFRRGDPAAALPYFVAAAELDPGNRQYEGMVTQLRLLDEGTPAAP